jgi:antitoxin ParD1/3/4
MPSSYVIGDHFEAFIKSQIRQGRYASASEVIRDGLRVLEDQQKFRAMKLETLRAEIEKGAASGQGIPAEQVFAEARARIVGVGASKLSKR